MAEVIYSRAAQPGPPPPFADTALIAPRWRIPVARVPGRPLGATAHGARPACHAAIDRRAAGAIHDAFARDRASNNGGSQLFSALALSAYRASGLVRRASGPCSARLV
jgi:hypothetical protein